ncbi:MAG: HD domain-containing protein [bacterium]
MENENKIELKIEITEDIILQLSQLAAEKNVKIYAVGGFVRDYFLKRKREDIDITVLGDSIEFAKYVAAHFKSKAVIYERFKTALVPVGKYKLEFVGTRKEEYVENSRNPIVTDGTFYDDIKRRDFTVNSIAVSLNKDDLGTIVDYFDGLKDLDAKILKTPLEPETTYSDDPLRMMRAARFAAQLNFEIEKESLDAISKMKDRIGIISQERITEELFKIIASDNPETGMMILLDTGLLREIFPELADLKGVEIVAEENSVYAHKDVLLHSIKVLKNVAAQTDNFWLRFTALVHDIGKPKSKRFIEGTGWSFHGHEETGARMMKRIFRRMRLPMDDLAYVEKLIRMHQRPMALVDEDITDSAIRRLAANAGADLEDLFTLVRADITTKKPNLEEKYKGNYERVFQKILDVQLRDKLAEFQSPVRGEEIMEICNIAPCRAVGVIKHNIEEAILDGFIPNEYEPAKVYFLANKELWMSEIQTATPDWIKPAHLK